MISINLRLILLGTIELGWHEMEATKFFLKLKLVFLWIRDDFSSWMLLF